MRTHFDPRDGTGFTKCGLPTRWYHSTTARADVTCGRCKPKKKGSEKEAKR